MIFQGLTVHSCFSRLAADYHLNILDKQKATRLSCLLHSLQMDSKLQRWSFHLSVSLCLQNITAMADDVAGHQAPVASSGKRRRVQRKGQTSSDSPTSSIINDVTGLQAQVLKLEAEMVQERAAKKEWETAATELSGLQAEVKRLEGEVGKAQERQHIAEQQHSVCSKEKTALISELVEVRKSLAAKEEELAVKDNQVKELMGIKSTGEVEQKELRQALEKAERALEEAAMAGVCKSQEGNRFHFVLASTGQAGSIPRSFLESEPESLLSKMYNGE
jgi:hypothetical protein